MWPLGLLYVKICLYVQCSGCEYKLYFKYFNAGEDKNNKTMKFYVHTEEPPFTMVVKWNDSDDQSLQKLIEVSFDIE